MRLRTRAIGIALCGALVAACGGSDDPPAPTGPPADAIIRLAADANDLHALDLRDQLVPLPGVEEVIYDQAQRRLRVDFTASATQAQKDKVLETARKAPGVAGAGGEGETDAPAQQPAPGAPSPS